jgi:hypothetical protein
MAGATTAGLIANPATSDYGDGHGLSEFGRLIDCLTADRLIDRMNAPLNDRLMDRPIDRVTDETDGRGIVWCGRCDVMTALHVRCVWVGIALRIVGIAGEL